MSDEKVISKKAADLIGDYGDARQEVSSDFGICPDDELYHEAALKALKNYVGDLEAMVERLIGICDEIHEIDQSVWDSFIADWEQLKKQMEPPA